MPQILEDTENIQRFSTNSNFKDSNVHRLSELKVAATKLILNTRTELIELLKLTLFDLTLKQVLIIKKSLRKSHPRDKYLREYIVVETGKNYSKYKPDNFEKYFTDRIDEESYFQLKPYLRAIFKEIPSNKEYKNEIIEDHKINDLFKNDLISNIFSRFKLSKKGHLLRNDISNYLNEIDGIIGNLINHEHEKALELLRFLQGNIFLLDNLRFELLENLKVISKAHQNNNDEYEDWFWLDFMYNDDLSISDISEIFDSVEDYFDFSGGADWSGDYDFDFD